MSTLLSKVAVLIRGQQLFLSPALIRGNTVFSIFANLNACKYTEYELCPGWFYTTFQNVGGATLLISCDGNKRSYILKQTSN